MGSRKRVKPNPKAEAEASQDLPEIAAQVPLPHDHEGSKELEPTVETPEKAGNVVKARANNGGTSTVSAYHLTDI